MKSESAQRVDWLRAKADEYEQSGLTSFAAQYRRQADWLAALLADHDRVNDPECSPRRPPTLSGW
jgi:hypothetical protein